MYKVLWELIPHAVQSKRKCESHDSCVCIAWFSACECQKKSVVYETECRHIAVQRGKQDQNHIIIAELKHTSDIIFNTFWNGKPVQFFQERCWVVVAAGVPRERVLQQNNRVTEGNGCRMVSRKTKMEREEILFCRRSVWADWFSVIHDFTVLSLHALNSSVRLVASLRGADFWSCVSSAESRWFTE